jgi:hypothetical protein
LSCLLSAVALVAGQNALPSGDSDKSLGEIARKARPKDAKITTQHVFTDDNVKHSGSQPAIPDPKGTVVDYRKGAETYLQATEAYLTDLQDKTPRQLGEIVAKEIQFPGRDNWENRLAASRDTLITKTQAPIFTVRREGSLLEGDDLNRAKEAQTVVNDQLLHIRLARQDFEHVLSEGATAAGEWERKPR